MKQEMTSFLTTIDDEIIDLCNLRNRFKDIIFDNKLSFEKSMNLLKDNINDKKLIIYENN